MKPFSTYPEDRARMLELCEIIESRNCTNDKPFEKAAYELADLVAAILKDEQHALDRPTVQNETQQEADLIPG